MIVLVYGVLPAVILAILGPLWAMHLWRQVRQGRLYHFTVALARFVRRNQPLVGALRAVRDDAVIRPAAVDPVIGQMVGGRTLGRALTASPRFFPPEYVALVDLGERTGQLPTVLDHLVADLDESRRHHEYLYARLAYPFALLFIYAAFAQFIMIRILPKFRDILKEFKITPPSTFEFITSLPVFVHLVGMLALLLYVGVVGFQALSNAGAWHATTRWRARLRRWRACFPTGRRYELSRFAASLSAALSGGATAPEALAMSAQTVSEPFAGAAREAARRVADGQTLSQALAAGPFPRTFLWMVESGEVAGRLPQALLQVHEIYLQRARRLTRFLQTLIVPATVLPIAALVAALAWTVLGSEIRILDTYSVDVGAGR
jgi:general secretion pathway protein F